MEEREGKGVEMALVTVTLQRGAGVQLQPDKAVQEVKLQRQRQETMTLLLPGGERDTLGNNENEEGGAGSEKWGKKSR